MIGPYLSTTCHTIIHTTYQEYFLFLGYIYSDLSLKLVLNNKDHLDYGTTSLAAANTYYFESLNRSHTGDWQCVVEQKDLRLKWITSYIRINVKKKPNIYTNLMEDKLTKPIFGWMKTEKNVLIGVIMIVVILFLLVVLVLVIYFKFFTLKRPPRPKVNNRRK